MAVRTILQYPNEALRARTAPVAAIDESVRALVQDLIDTMRAAPGLGLAATQIGDTRRVFVVDAPRIDASLGPDPIVCINPRMVAKTGQVASREGCLSFAGLTETVTRAARAHLRATNLAGQTYDLHAHGLLAVALQHEHDHLNAILMVDRLHGRTKYDVERAMRARM